MRPAWFRGRSDHSRSGQRGQTLAEFALVLPLVLGAILGVLQFGLYMHARSVALGAAQEGARLAAGAGRNVGDGIQEARALLHAGFGRDAVAFTVSGSQGAAVLIRVDGQIRTIIPWIDGNTIPISETARMHKEVFQPGP